MTALSSFFKEDVLKERVSEAMNEFHQARTEYELAMRREILHRVNHCPCCFDGLFEEVRARIREEAFRNNFEPDVMEVLQRMSNTPVVTEEEMDDLIEKSIH